MSRHHNQTKMSTNLKSVEYYYDIKNVLESYKISYKIINPIRIETQKIKKKIPTTPQKIKTTLLTQYTRLTSQNEKVGQEKYNYLYYYTTYHINL